MRHSLTLGAYLAFLAACGGSSSGDDDVPDAGGPLFPEVEECEGQAIVPFAGDHAMVLSSMRIGTKEEGFDLDRDGEPDNQMAGLGTLANGSFEDSFADLSIVLPIEFFDFADPAPDDCVKFAFYVGEYKLDTDQDGSKSVEFDGDCNDLDAEIGPGHAEVDGNRIDDDCDGLADDLADVPSTSTTDGDADGVSVAEGDCDDTRATVATGEAEICGDQLDNDCDGVADWTGGAADPRACSPYDGTPDAVRIDPTSFSDVGAPKVQFGAATATMDGDLLRLNAGPSLFQLDVPVDDGLSLAFVISGASLVGDLVMTSAGWGIDNGRLGGVIDARTADRIRGLDVEQIDLKPEDSLLDAIYANVLSVLLSLKRVGGEGEFAGCFQPDIDVDQDGLEAFCDSNPMDEVNTVDICIDGDGTVVRDGDGGVVHCTDAVDGQGGYRFQDGISIALAFDAVATQLGAVLEP